jgi:hypothetical protein
MSGIRRRLSTGALAAIGIMLYASSPAAADPNGDLIVESVCDDGNTYTTVARAAQNFNAQLVTDSTSAFLLTAYDFNVFVTAADGSVVFQGSFPEIERGRSDGRQKNLLECTYDYTFERDDGTTVHAWGTARGYVTPQN